ncbi:hypothetical protein, partial [Paenarthrobacter sp. NPDC058040]|uniref:hypothetical protein n=1 Tax=unclassified Paenarthrobacter TaxID=2634190 RepID=UPI0036D7A395
ETQPPPPEITAKTAANLKPAENQTTTHGGARWLGNKFQPIGKTIGINKLGTLLSSQTTDPPKHHPRKHHTQQRNHQGPLEKKSYFGRQPEPYTPSGFPFRSRRLRKQYTPQHPNANPPLKAVSTAYFGQQVRRCIPSS